MNGVLIVGVESVRHFFHFGGLVEVAQEESLRTHFERIEDERVEGQHQCEDDQEQEQETQSEEERSESGRSRGWVLDFYCIAFFVLDAELLVEVVDDDVDCVAVGIVGAVHMYVHRRRRVAVV